MKMPAPLPVLFTLAAGGLLVLSSKSKQKSALLQTPGTLLTDTPGPLFDVKGASGGIYQVRVVKMFTAPAGSPAGFVEKFYDVFAKGSQLALMRFKQVGNPAQYDAGKRDYVTSNAPLTDPALQVALADFKVTAS